MNKKGIPEQEDQKKPTGLNPKYRVDNWQIPVPIGDASAHFLVQVCANNEIKVINAFFMDGGEDGQNGDTAWSQIANALKVINNAYGEDWVFDAVATTHHDSDHFKGLKDLMTEKIDKSPGSPTYRKRYFAKRLTHYAGNPNAGNGWNGNQTWWSPSNSDPVIAGKNAIGVDMFSRTRLFNRNNSKNLTLYDDDRGIKKWVDTAAQIKRPRFVIVGANGYGMHINPADSRMIKSPSENQKSLLAIVYWPATGHTSYFTGGDGSPKVELGGVVPWMEANKETNKTRKQKYPILPVDMVKLDHHGSLNESLNDKSLAKLHYTILDEMAPRQVLVTPGHKYGHPNWVILQLVRNHFIKLKRAETDDLRKEKLYKLFTTRSPYWMTKKNVGMMDANINHAAYEKVIEVLEEMEGRFDEGGVGIDALFLAETENWAVDTEQKQEFVKQLDALLEWQDYFDEDGNPKMGDINHKLNLDFDKMKRELRASHEILKSRRKTSEEREEPLMTEGHDHKQIIQEDRNIIVWHARQTWSEISSQEICDEGGVYFLVRFWFEEGSPPTIDGTMDETGKKKPAQSTLAKTEEIIKTKEVVDDDGIETIIVKSKKSKPDGYEYADATGSVDERNGYMNWHTQKEIDCNLAKYFNNILILGELQANPLQAGLGINTSAPRKRATKKSRKKSPVLRDMTAEFIDSDDPPSAIGKRNSKQQKMSRAKTPTERTADFQEAYGKAWAALKMKRLKEAGLLPDDLVPFDQKGDSEEDDYEPDSSDDEAGSADQGKAVGKKVKTGRDGVKTRKQPQPVLRSQSSPNPKTKRTKKTTDTKNVGAVKSKRTTRKKKQDDSS